MRWPGRAPTALPLGVLILSACHPATEGENRFQQWAAGPTQVRLSEYRHYLEQRQVSQVVPLSGLARSSRRWRECGADDFSLPPRHDWPNLVPVLQGAAITARRQHRHRCTGLASVYRGEALNRCSGGSSRSRRLSGSALDLDLPQGTDHVPRLCAYWRKHGPALRLGLGFYTPTRIHLDTSGFRTWGNDHTRRSSLCHADKKTAG